MTRPVKRKYFFWVLITSLVIAAGCRSSGENAPTLTTLSVVPGSQSISTGANQQFIATGTFSDSTTQDLTSQVTWTSSDPAKTAINGNGLATGIAAGTAIITATSGILSVSSALTITTASLPGYNWTASSISNDLRRIYWFESRFTALDNQGVILTSQDGISWTPQTSAASYQLNGVAWSGTQFVSVGHGSGGGTILTSPDGVVWTPQITPQISGLPVFDLVSVLWSGTTFVAVGGQQSGVEWGYIPGAGAILTSTDGVTWASQTVDSIEILNDIAWSGKQFAAVGDGGTILTSPDGVLWTRRDSNAYNGLISVIWSGGQFVVAGYGGTVLTSPDGISWTPQITGAPYGLPSTPYALLGIAWSGEQFAAVGDRGTILTSPDGVVWSPQNSETVNNLYGIAWSGSQFLAVGKEIILSSP